MTSAQRLGITILFVLTISAILIVRVIYIYPGRPIPPIELFGAVGTLLFSVPFIWMKRLFTLPGTMAVAVPCISWGVVAIVLWMSKSRALAIPVCFLFAWYAFDWIKKVRIPEKRSADDSSKRQSGPTNSA